MSQLWDLWFALLDSEDGISAEQYNALYDLCESVDPERLKQESRFVDATDNRFYISSK